MTHMLSYADALKILGSKETRLVKVIGFAAAAERTGWALAGGGQLMPGLFDLRNDVVRYGEDVMRRLPELKSGVDRFTHTQRLAAAHAAIVVAAYLEAFGEAKLPFTLDRLDRSDKIANGMPTAERFAALVASLLLERLPTPEPHVPYAETRQAVERAYQRMSEAVTTYVGGLAVWEELSQDERLLLPRMLAEGPPAHAIRIYDEDYRSLALDSHEFGVRTLVTERPGPGAGLSRVAWLLAELAPPRVGDSPVIHRARMAANTLDQPLLAAGKAPADVTLPLLGEGYITPACRVAELSRESTPADKGWWSGRRLLVDTEAFLVGHLTSLRATQAPLLVLGEPGSGKSKLAEVLAARLARSEFLPIRVELRGAAAGSSITGQIEQAVRTITGAEMTYAELVTAGDGALPVILLDGFDELIQSGGDRYDYHLERVQEFQRHEAGHGRPVVVIVTSRTVVADRIRFPDGVLALQLQPFDDDQVRQWLDIWDQTNRATLARRKLKPLSSGVALAQGEPARQPLLLLLFALYDAAGNALRRERAPIGRARLYESLIREFTARELAATAGESPADPAVERELLELGVAALSMFARGRQVLTEEALATDLPALFGPLAPGEAGVPVDWVRRVTERFFFVRGNGHAFLHATFGEFLVAWLTVYALRDLDRRHRAAGDLPLQPVDDDLLHTVTSFSCLAERGPTVGFLLELLADLPADVRSRCAGLLTGLLRTSLDEQPRRHFTAFRPVRPPVTRRLAAYSANLALLVTGVRDEPVTVSELLGEPGHLERWTSLTHLWKGQLGREGWTGLVTALGAHRVVTAGREDVVLGGATGAGPRVMEGSGGLDGGGGMGDVVAAVATGHAPRHRRLLDLLLRALGEGAELPPRERVGLLGELVTTAAVRSPAMCQAVGALWTRGGAAQDDLRPVLHALLADPGERMATWELLVKSGIPEDVLWEIHQDPD
ncbi:AAA family ATPase [Nonomuraea sp. NN258]|uniref:NACHT domain-containing protein n=1 Tax=Nonomuraea antri TaxID=2730852 RepID=UPI001569E5C1|nr:AAA family ATPase [Nonomuraea antri]NRQ33546.1 AAA family ATPase [Nonomuraea antri]